MCHVVILLQPPSIYSGFISFSNFEHIFMPSVILCIHSADGSLQISGAGVLWAFVDFYKNLYSPLTHFNINLHSFLDTLPLSSFSGCSIHFGCPFRLRRHGLQLAPNCKSPCPDGLTVEWYKHDAELAPCLLHLYTECLCIQSLPP